MTSFVRICIRTLLASVVLIAGIVNTAQAQLTPAGDTIANRATVNYTVGGVPQTLIESSPTGNTAPGSGLGEDTEFLVDQVVDLTVSEVSGSATLTVPGASAAVTTFTVTNDGNAPQGYALLVDELDTSAPFGDADNYDIGLANLSIRVDEDPSGGDGTGNGIYDGTESATAIDTLNPGQTITVFVLANVPPGATDGLFANVNLEAQTAVAGTAGATPQAETSNPTNEPDVVDVIFGDEDSPTGTDYDGAANAVDQYAIESATLEVEKISAVISDPFGSSPALAVPGAIVEYTITITNNSTSTAAAGVVINDPLPADTTFVGGVYVGSSDVLITSGAAASCIAEAGGVDTNGDSCYRTATDLIVGAAAIGSIAVTPDTVTVQFRVSID